MQGSIDSLVGKRLRQYRRLRGYSLIEFSAMLHRSKSAISKYERGEVSIDLRTLNEMARLLDIPLSALLLDEQEAVQVSSLFHLPTSAPVRLHVERPPQSLFEQAGFIPECSHRDPVRRSGERGELLRLQILLRG